MIIGNNISKTFIGDPLFERISFSLGNFKKVALVGKNGCGKSTLFKIIIGEITPDVGTITFENEIVSYIPQEWTFPDELVGEYLEKKLEYSWEFYKIETLVKQLRFNNFDPYQPLQTLSEGQKMKVKLLESLLSDPTILLIDEPTNHLDIEGIMWFENYLKHLNKTVLMISHDRQFLNNTIDEIWEIDNKKLTRYVGDYDYYKKEKLLMIGRWNEDYERFLKKKAQLEKLLENARRIKDGKKRGTAVSSAKKRMEREIEENEKTKYVDKKVKDINFDTGVTHSKLMVQFTNVDKSYGSKNIFNNLSFDIRGGEKVWLFGPNGAGKSTIIKLIMQEELVTGGILKLGSDIKIGYFAQNHTKINSSASVLDYFLSNTDCPYDKAFGLLKNYLFEKDDLKKQVNSLSPGQRARFAFAIFATKDYDMLILDEPDNHLDINTKEVLENSLNEYRGTLLLVSHDRFFVERVGVNKMLNLKDGTISEYN